MCDESPTTDVAALRDDRDGGEVACWAHLVCLECGALTVEGHRPGCPFALACDDGGVGGAVGTEGGPSGR